MEVLNCDALLFGLDRKWLIESATKLNNEIFRLKMAAENFLERTSRYGLLVLAGKSLIERSSCTMWMILYWAEHLDFLSRSVRRNKANQPERWNRWAPCQIDTKNAWLEWWAKPGIGALHKKRPGRRRAYWAWAFAGMPSGYLERGMRSQLRGLTELLSIGMGSTTRCITRPAKSFEQQHQAACRYNHTTALHHFRWSAS